MLFNGVTTTCEQYLHPGPVTDAALASGIRCVLTPGVFDVPGRDPRRTWQAHLAEACRIFDEMDGREGRLHVGFGPHAAYSLPPAGLAAVAEEAQRRGALMQIHLAETEAEGRVIEERYGMRAPALLASLGVLEGRGAGGPCRLARRGGPGAHGRPRRGRGALPREQRQAGLRRGQARRHVGSGDPGRPRHRRARLQRRSPPVGRDAPGRHFGPGHRGRSRPPSARRPPSGWPPEAAGRPWASRSGPSRSAGRPTSSACAPTTPGSSRPPTRPSCWATWSGPAPATW